MKKALPLIMAALVAATLAGCGSTKTEATTAAPAETTTAAAAETTKEEAKAEESTEAVSYTHLDVYKRQGYGLYDRALGATYLNGLWEAIDKMSRQD